MVADALTDVLELTMKDNAVQGLLHPPCDVHAHFIQVDLKDSTRCSDLPSLRSQLVGAIVVVVSKDCILTEPDSMPTTLELALNTNRQTNSVEAVPSPHLYWLYQVEEALTIDMTSSLDLKFCSHDDLQK